MTFDPDKTNISEMSNVFEEVKNSLPKWAPLFGSPAGKYPDQPNRQQRQTH